jgi:hypothetical protein
MVYKKLLIFTKRTLCSNAGSSYFDIYIDIDDSIFEIFIPLLFKPTTFRCWFTLIKNRQEKLLTLTGFDKSQMEQV